MIYILINTGDTKIAILERLKNIPKGPGESKEDIRFKWPRDRRR